MMGNLGSIGTESASRQSSPSKPEEGKGRQNQIKKATASNRASYSSSSKPIAYFWSSNKLSKLKKLSKLTKLSLSHMSEK